MQLNDKPKHTEPRDEFQPMTSQQLQSLMQLLDEWTQDETGYDEETWDQLAQAIDEERDQISARRLFG